MRCSDSELTLSEGRTRDVEVLAVNFTNLHMGNRGETGWVGVRLSRRLVRP